jgi:putative flavoprotein involved in K+ transport
MPPDRGETVDYTDVLIVGAGAAGVGVAVALSHLEGLSVALVDKNPVGHSFACWPKETRFITPSFTANAFGLTDLNAVTPDTSPAFSLGKEHPSGPEYARYLQAVAQHFGLEVRKAAAKKIIPGPEGFTLQTSKGPMEAKFVVWAVGERSFPYAPLEGSEHAIHYSKVRSWAKLKGHQHLVIGGYESGIDAAHNLASLGHQVLVLDPNAPWESQSGEPSTDLSPYTQERLEAAMDTGLVKLVQMKVNRIDFSDGMYSVEHPDGVIRTKTQPILATGFSSGLGLVQDHFEFEGQKPLLKEDTDESTLTPGLFMAGPKVNHRNTAFCFIYKFRGRFPVVASAIANRMGLAAPGLEIYRKRGMWADDLAECCTSRCAC